MDEYEYLLNAAFRFLSFRARSEKEMVAYLQKKAKGEKSGGTRARVLARLKELALVDDVKFASWWIEQRTGHKPKGTVAMKLELAAKGVAGEIIEEALVRYRESRNEVDTARRAAEKKLTRFAKYPILERKKRLYDFLARRGFPGNTISRAIDGIIEKDYNNR